LGVSRNCRGTPAIHHRDSTTRLSACPLPQPVVRCAVPTGHPDPPLRRFRPFTVHLPLSTRHTVPCPLPALACPPTEGVRGQGSAGEGAAGAPDAQRATDNGGEGVRGRGSGVRRTRVRPPLAVRQTPSVVLSSAVVREEPCPRRFRLFTVQCSVFTRDSAVQYPSACRCCVPPAARPPCGRAQPALKGTNHER